jgi:hypothetical protein
VFDGRQLTETTTYEHDEHGRVVRATTVREAEWTDQDRAEILALALYRSQLCPLHHGPLSECTSHDDTGPQFKVRKIRCRATDALIGEQEATKLPKPGALLWSVSAEK